MTENTKNSTLTEGTGILDGTWTLLKFLTRFNLHYNFNLDLMSSSQTLLD